jgi:hypothetical protein
VPEKTHIEFLIFFSAISSEIVEDTFEDSLASNGFAGTNITGIY